MPQKVELSSVFLGQDWWESKIHPKQILNQKFATVLSDEDLSNADAHEYKGFKIRPRMPASMKASGSSEVKIDKHGFQVSLDLDEFELEELSVKTFDRFVEVHGKHEEKTDRYGLVSREFRRRYMVPYSCDIEALSSSFSADYKLTINAPASQNEQKMLNIAVQVPVVEKELNTLVIKLVQEEYLDIIQKRFLEATEQDQSANLAKKELQPQINLESLKIIENAIYDTFNKFRVTDVSPKPPAESSTDVSPKPPAESSTDVSPKPPDESSTDVSPKPPAEPSTVEAEDVMH